MRTKTRQDKIEKQRKSFFMIGMILALFMVLAAFEYRTYDALSLDDFTHSGHNFIDEEFVINTKQEKPEPPTPIAKPVIAINEVDDGEDVGDTEIFDAGADPLDEVPEFIYTPPDEIVDEGEDDFFVVVEQMPEFPGGMDALFAYLISNTHFTHMAIDMEIDGKLYVGFIVEKDGSISNVEVLRGLGYGLDEICVEAVSNMPRWTPGKQRGIPVRVGMNVPFNFKLQ